MYIDWSRVEVEATVADYFAMLQKELLGQTFSKTEHRLQLLKLLQNRSEGAVERKHQNISAILIDYGFPYIDGYKPLRNYQHLLQDVVVDRLAADVSLRELLRVQVTEPVSLPTVENILGALEDLSDRDSHKKNYTISKSPDQVRVRRGVDYLEMETRNRSLGSAGEEFVVRYETARLIYDGQERLAASIERVSETRGDGLGYDVLSFDTNGRERLIEVKTTSYGKYTPFFVTPNEVAVSQARQETYHIYRVFNFRKDPKLFTRNGAIEKAFSLTPSEFEARIG
jgi:hypothetical protein